MADKIKFKSFMTICDSNDSCIGNRFYTKHIRQLGNDKCPVLVKTDIIDRQAIIDSFADSCDINNIVKSMSVETYEKLVNDMKNAVQFIDATKIPTNIFEMQNFKYQMQDKFNSLPVDLKEIYDNNYNKFIESIENGKVKSIVSKYFDNLYNRSNIVLNVGSDDSVKGGESNA